MIALSNINVAIIARYECDTEKKFELFKCNNDYFILTLLFTKNIKIWDVFKLCIYY